jgi:hypothetical protein
MVRPFQNCLIVFSFFSLALGTLSCRTTQLAYDLDGSPYDPISTDSVGTVLIFVRTDCPVSNRYAPTLRRICKTYTGRDIRFFLVYPNPDVTPPEIRKHMTEYSYPCPALRDPEHTLVRRAGAKITPEAAVFTRDGELVYRGRIDNQYVDFGKYRPKPTRADLEEALDAVLTGKRVTFRETEAIGCLIEDLR